jgi:hypothetical protein
MPLRRGDRTAVVLPVFDPARLCALVAEHRVRRLQLVPAMAQLLLDSSAIEGHDSPRSNGSRCRRRRRRQPCWPDSPPRCRRRRCGTPTR